MKQRGVVCQKQIAEMRCKNAGENLETYMVLSNGVIDSRKALDSYGEIETTTNHSYCPEREREREREGRREGGRESPQDSERVSESNALH